MYVCMSYGIHSGDDKQTHFAKKNPNPNETLLYVLTVRGKTRNERETE